MARLFKYWLRHGLPTGFRSFRLAVINWMDLMWFTENQARYAIFREDNALEECLLFFWDSLEDNTLDIEAIEYIERIVEDINNGNIELIPFNPGMFDLTDSDE